jgi:shikimate kinase
VNVILTGMRGTGKSSIGRLLAKLLAFTCVDTDVLIEECAGQPIADIVAAHGWAYFRTLERQVVQRIAIGDQQVVATGGGTLIDQDNAQRLKTSGIVVLLICDIAILQQRITRQGNRPSLTGQGSAAMELTQVWEERRARYLEVADLTYDVSSESADSGYDLKRKAMAIHHLLQQARIVQQ